MSDKSGSEASSNAGDDATVFASRAEADAARAEGVRLFNAGDIEGALKQQERVLRYYIAAHGELAPECGVAYLDYGVSLLAAIQNTSSDAAMLAGNGENLNEDLEEDLEACYEMIETAKACFQGGINAIKQKIAEAKGGAEQKKALEDELAATELRLAEAHATMGEYWIENDDEEPAIENFNSAIELRSKYLPEHHRLVVSVHFDIARAYNGLQMYEQAVAELDTAIAKAQKGGDANAAIVADLAEYRDDMKKLQAEGGLAEVRKVVEDMFPNEQGDVDQPFGTGANGTTNNKIYGEVPNMGNEDSLPLAADVNIPYLPTDASNSMSHFPSQGRDKNSSNSQPQPAGINKAVVVRSKKGAGAAPATSSSSNNNSNAPVSQKENKKGESAGARREREE